MDQIQGLSPIRIQAPSSASFSVDSVRVAGSTRDNRDNWRRSCTPHPAISFHKQCRLFAFAVHLSPQGSRVVKQLNSSGVRILLEFGNSWTVGLLLGTNLAEISVFELEFKMNSVVIVRYLQLWA